MHIDEFRGRPLQGIARVAGAVALLVSAGVAWSLSVAAPAGAQSVQATIPTGDGSIPEGLAFTSDGSRAYVTDFGTNDVSVIDTNPSDGGYNTVIATIPVGQNPVAIAIGSNGDAFVANSGAGTVSVIDTNPGDTGYNTVIGSFPVGSLPDAVAVAPNDSRVYVANGGSATVSVNSATTFTSVATLAVGTTPAGIAFSSGGGSHVYVINYDSQNVTIISAGSTPTVSGSFSLGGATPTGITVSNATGDIYVATTSDVAVYTSNGSPITTITTPNTGNDQAITMAANGQEAFVDNSGSADVLDIDVNAADPAYNQVTYSGTSIGTGCFSLADNSDNILYVSCLQQNTVLAVDDSPSVGGLSPSSGGPGDSVTLTGTGFDEPGLSVTFSGSAGPATVTANSATSVTVTVPSDAETGPITVATSLGTATSGTFHNGTTATITSFTPTSVAVGATVTIHGTEMLSVSAVDFWDSSTSADDVSATFTAGSNSTLTATVPPGAATGPISVTAPGGTEASSASITVVPPTISRLSPTQAHVGANVSIEGVSLAHPSAVYFSNGSTESVLATIKASSATKITVTVPAGAATGTIEVVNPGGTAISPSFSVEPAGITSFGPASGFEGAMVTIHGYTLSDASNLEFNGTPATILTDTSTAITADVPATATTGPITVDVPGPQGSVEPILVTSARSFTVKAPTFSNFSPTSGAPGDTIALNGNGMTEVTSVTFGSGASTTPSSATLQQAMVVVPSGAATGKITVTWAGGTVTSRNSFTVTGSPPSD